MAVKEIKLAEIDFSRSSRTKVTFSRTQDLDWAEEGVFTVYLDVQHENGEAEVIELGLTSDYVDYDNYVNQSGQTTLDVLVTVRLFNDDDGGVGLFGDSTEALNRTVCILSAATDKYIKSDFVGFDQENLTADDLELELKKRDLGELYLNNRESRVRASTDHTLSNLPIDINNPNSEPEDVAASRRQIARAFAAESNILIDDASLLPVAEEVRDKAPSRRTVVQAIDEASIDININVNQAAERLGVDTDGLFKIKLTETHSADVALDTNFKLEDSTYVLPELDDQEVFWMDVGKQTATAHPEGRLVAVSVREIRELSPLSTTSLVNTSANISNSKIIRDVIANGISLYLARDANNNLLVAVSDADHDLLPLKIYAMVAEGTVKISTGTTGNINDITDAGVPQPDISHDDGTTDRIIWVRNNASQGVSSAVRTSAEDITITPVAGSSWGSWYGYAKINEVQYIWEPDATDVKKIICKTIDGVAVPGMDLTIPTNISVDTNNPSASNGALIMDVSNNKIYIRGFGVSALGILLTYTIDPTALTVSQDTDSISTNLNSFSQSVSGGGSYFHSVTANDYMYTSITANDSLSSGFNLKRAKIRGSNATGTEDTFYSDTDAQLVTTGLVAPAGKTIADSSYVRLVRIRDVIIAINATSGNSNYVTPMYNISAIELGGDISPIGFIDLTPSGAAAYPSIQIYLFDSNEADLWIYPNSGGSWNSFSATATALQNYSFASLTVFNTTYHGIDVNDLATIAAGQISLQGVASPPALNTDLEYDSQIHADAESATSPPTRRSVARGLFEVIRDFSNDAIVDGDVLPPIIQREDLPDSITEDDGVHYSGTYYGPDNAADAPPSAVAYNANKIAIANGEIYVKELITLGMYHEEHVDWRGYSDPVVMGVNTSGGQYIGAFRTEADLPASRADHDYWYDYGDHHWYIQFGNSSEYVDADGNPDPGVDPVYVLWTSGPQAANAASPFNPGISNVFPGSWKREVNSREAASRRVRGNTELFFFDGAVNTSFGYVNANSPFFVYVWKRLTDLGVGDIIPYLDGALGGDEWRSGLTSEALTELTDRVTANELELDALDGVVAATDQHEESINTMSSGDPNSSGTIKQKLSVDMTNAEASRIRTQHLADEAKYNRGQFVMGSTYEGGQSVHYLGVRYWAIGRITNAQLTPDIDLTRWTTTEDTRVHNALSFDGIPLHADDIIYVDIGPRIDGITEDYFVAGSETTNHNSVGRVYNIPASSNSAFAEVGSFLAAAPTTSLKQFEGLCNHIASIDVGGVNTIYEYLFSPYAEYNADNSGSFQVHGMMKDGVNFTTAGIDRGTATSYSSYNPTRQSSVMGIDIISVAADGLSFVVGVISSNSLDGDGFAQVKLFTQTYTIDATDGSMILSGQDNQILDVPPSFIAEAMSSPADNVVSIVGVDSLAIDAVYEVKSYNALDGAAIDEYGAIINSIRPVINVHDHTDYVTGFTAEGLSGSLIEFKMSIPQIDTQTGMNRDSGGGIYGFRRSGLAQQVIDNTRAIERIESAEPAGGTPGPQGPEGPQGPQGDTGPPGTGGAGVSLIDLYDSDETADTLPTFTARFFSALGLSATSQAAIVAAEETDILEVLILCQKSTAANAFSGEAFEIAMWKWRMLGHAAASESTTGSTGDTWTKLSIRIENASGTSTDTVGIARGAGEDVLVYTSDTNNQVPVRIVIKLRKG